MIDEGYRTLITDQIDTSNTVARYNIISSNNSNNTCVQTATLVRRTARGLPNMLIDKRGIDTNTVAWYKISLGLPDLN